MATASDDAIQHATIMAEPLEGPENMSCEVIQLVIDDIIECVMPRHALSHVKCCLSRQCVKPQEIGVRAHYQHLVFINTQETPWIPPFKREQAFIDDIIKENPLFVTPPEWQREMDRMGFDPTYHDSLRVLHFMENVDAAKTSIPVGTGVCSPLSRFSAHAREAGRCNTTP
jgi:hypothetical protein